MKIAIIGADGQLGTDLCKIIDKSSQAPLTLNDIDITNESLCKSVLSGSKPDIVINTAAYHRVDACEENDVEAYKVNAHGAKNLAIACRDINAKLVHISTDYVFDGDKTSPYTEDTVPTPRSAYGISKLAGEQFIKYLWEKHFIVRTSGLYGAAGCLGKGGGNFVENMIKRAKNAQEIKVVTDEVLTPTYTRDLAKKIYQIIKTHHFGLYHITNAGSCSWWEYADQIFKFLKMNIIVQKTNANKYKTKARRPKNSVLAHLKLKELGIDDMPDWKEGLKAYLIEKEHIKP
ncbi:dTDP-4-dehydrorhamnose reductase [Candidatus Saganbacteria bacterium]|nr:dTDP-4-dehydrorhamnose reductase [Candidatus Saganbacteria bacterium]